MARTVYPKRPIRCDPFVDQMDTIDKALIEVQNQPMSIYAINKRKYGNVSRQRAAQYPSSYSTSLGYSTPSGPHQPSEAQRQLSSHHQNVPQISSQISSHQPQISSMGSQPSQLQATAQMSQTFGLSSLGSGFGYSGHGNEFSYNGGHSTAAAAPAQTTTGLGSSFDPFSSIDLSDTRFNSGSGSTLNASSFKNLTSNIWGNSGSEPSISTDTSVWG
ncbi:hypothetical protein CANTEDRAFT_113248 [Yamadazyma tenuis ATCC 10573]|uniref:Uncharacterized protein n=1 Tax=Candida tenuis (strain ATCC 10573 / BCRC 21748 / CBS 615 / JCM 9827 / NBRC 10315 / NRRL Y-1498 / VKM Y-70) TaxID=590646 RepID=G3B1M1_CANTC|nr:uncharacterized protein CANTEDRAFT_113248 [Yamadazyma tenuis ATCC 10573]EGV64480.1 hypothetical protein CANTEDRAFT_113248 [Yamadazyma tenuis ATCC 10573]